MAALTIAVTRRPRCCGGRPTSYNCLPSKLAALVHTSDSSQPALSQLTSSEALVWAQGASQPWWHSFFPTYMCLAAITGPQSCNCSPGNAS